MNMNNPSFTRFVSGVGRQGTAMTTSTNFSIGSAKEAYYDLKNKLHSYGRADVKDIFRLLKRYTISNEAGSDRSGFSPNSATGGFQQPDLNFRGQTSGVTGIGATKYSLPGDFLNTPTFQYHPVTNTDQFGNTMYHFYAASPQGDGILIGLVSAASDADLNATNTGGQTFLHVLNGSWFEDEMRLTQLVDTLRLRQFNFFAADAYGRTFFHVLRSNMDMNFTRNITRHFNMSQINRRDAFGAKPLLGRASTISGNREPSLLAIPGLVDRNQQKIKEHAQLLSIITGVNDPSRRYPEEDNQGRNALHCLSEVILGMAALDAHVSGTPMKGIKRKMDVKDDPVLQACSLSHRLQFLETVLQANVDVNHYNSQGNTVLMSFVTHIIDGQDDKDLEQLIKRLIEAGANLEARNRSGETVLQVAAKNGQKFAVRVLLEQGANCHVHNSDGRSVLQSVDDMLQLSGEYPEQIARLEATRGVLCGRFSKEKVMQEPSLLQEWAIRSPTIPNLA